MAAHVVIFVGLVCVEYADDSAITLVGEFQQLMDKLLGLGFVVERSHELHDAVDEYHIGLLILQGLTQQRQQLVMVAAT